MSFFKLPRAVIETILYELPATDLSSCLLATKYLNEIVTTSMRLVLKRRLAHLGAEINPFSSFSTSSERQHALEESTRNWSTLTPKFMYSVNIPNEAGHVWNKEGVLFCVRRDLTGIWYMQLARTEQESLNTAPVWYFVDLDSRQLINFNLYLYEHDLLAVVTSNLDLTGQNLNAMPEFNIHILLRRFSTQSPHPRASISEIFVMKSPLQRPHVAIDIVGRHLVVVVHLCGHPDPPLRGEYIYVYNWQTGTLLMEFTAPMHSYESVVFLDEHLILIPNTYPPDSEGRFDIFRIPTEPNSSTRHAPIVALQFPTLRYGSRYILAKAQHGTNPIAKDSWSEMYRRYTETTSRQYQQLSDESHTGASRSDGLLPLELDTFHSQRPFIMRGEDALCGFTFVTGGLQITHAPNGVVYQQQQQNERFTMKVHRRALLRAVEQYAPKLTNISRRPMRQTLWHSVEEPALNQTTPPHPAATPSNTVPQPNIAGQDQALSSSQPAPNFGVAHRTPVPAISVAWAQWGGPFITRWFKTDNTSMSYLGVSVGERCVDLAYETRPAGDPAEGDAVRMPTAYHIFEFNWYLCQNSTRRRLNVVQKVMRGILRGQLDHSVDSLGDQHGNMNEDSNGPATTSTRGDSEGSQAIATPNDPEAVNPFGNKILDIPSSPYGGVYDKTSITRILHKLTEITETQNGNYASLIEKMRMLRQRRIDPLKSAEFDPPVVCELPFMIASSSKNTEGRINWESIMMDEERLMGLCRDEDGIAQKVEIHHFG